METKLKFVICIWQRYASAVTGRVIKQLKSYVPCKGISAGVFDLWLALPFSLLLRTVQEAKCSDYQKQGSWAAYVEKKTVNLVNYWLLTFYRSFYFCLLDEEQHVEYFITRFMHINCISVFSILTDAPAIKITFYSLKMKFSS